MSSTELMCHFDNIVILTGFKVSFGKKGFKALYEGASQWNCTWNVLVWVHTADAAMSGPWVRLRPLGRLSGTWCIALERVPLTMACSVLRCSRQDCHNWEVLRLIGVRPTLAWRRHNKLLFLWALLNKQGPSALASDLPKVASGHVDYSLRGPSPAFPRCLTSLHLRRVLPMSIELSLFKAGPLDVSFWSLYTFLHHGIKDVERHLLWKVYKKIRRKSWSNVPPKLLACIRFLYKVVHKIGRLRKFNRSREIEFNFLTAWTISMKIWHTCSACPWLQNLPQIF